MWTKAKAQDHRPEVQNEVPSRRRQWPADGRPAVPHRRQSALMVESVARREWTRAAYEMALAAHEQWLAAEQEATRAEYEPGGVGGKPGPQVPVRSHEILKHWRRREDHEQVKSQHYTVLAYWSLLLQTVLGPLARTDA